MTRKRAEISHALADAEHSVIGCVLLRNEVVARIHLDPSDFVHPILGRIWAAILELERAHSAIDPITICNRLNGLADKATMVLVACQSAVPTSDNVEFYAEIVATAALERRLRENLADVSSDPTLGAPEILARAQRVIDALAPRRLTTSPTRIAAVVDEILAEAALPVIPTGFVALDSKLGGGLRARMYHVIIAGSGRGKTSLAVQISARHAETAPVLYYSGELTRAQLAARLIGQRLGRSWRDVLRGDLAAVDMRAVLEPLEFDILRGCPNPMQAITDAADEMLSRGHGVPLIVIDYAQIIADIAATEPRFAVMLAIRQLAALVETRDVVVILLSQGSRASARAMRQGSGGAEDYVDAGGESSDIEKFASTVLTLVYGGGEGQTTHEVTVMIAKQRLGGPDRVGLSFHGPSGRWADLGHDPLTPAQRQESERRQAILDLVARHPAHFTRTELKAAIGGDVNRNAASIQTLIDAGELVCTSIVRRRSDGQRQVVQAISIASGVDE